ncbi:MAG: monofunctional biosynthetic peptidoglycan transglycosylase [Bdellovibrionaceae bacterium]|nr:monofunctional biosynthetic peptidoglycan transglycosylase [Pseudobdellovibrionaceae bacterium]
MKKTLLISFAVIIVTLSSFVLWVWFQIPTEQQIRGCIVTTMYKVALCPGSKDYVPLSRISPYIQKAIVLSEDALFWQHKGFDWDQLEKSAERNWEKGAYLRGGSTITQQLAKNMFLSKEKSLMRKGLEALITLRLEETLSKKEILERYLNVVEFGRNIFGVKAASQHYFNKTPAELDPVESAFLAMLLPNPVKYSSSHQQKNLTDFGRKRVSKILTDMMKTGKMSNEEFAAAVERMEHFLDPEAAAAAQELLQEARAAEEDPFESPNQLVPDAPNGDVHAQPADEEDQGDVGESLPGETD